MAQEASDIPVDALHRAHQEEGRGADPAVLEDLGYFVIGASSLQPEDEERVMNKLRQELNGTPVEAVRPPARAALSSAAQNRNAREFERRHFYRTQPGRQIQPGH